MPAPTYTVPSANSDTATEEPKIITALAEIKSILNGDIDSDNLAANAVALSKLATSIQQALVPVGAVFPYAGSSAPSGFVMADGTNPGSGASGQPYEALYGVIGNTFGGTTAANFLTPNLKGRIPVGRDAASGGFDTLAETGGVSEVTLTALQSGLRAHAHTITDPGHGHLITGFSGGVGSPGGTHTQLVGTTNGGMASQDTTTGITINDHAATDATQAHTNLQPYLVVNYIIKF